MAPYPAVRCAHSAARCGLAVLLALLAACKLGEDARDGGGPIRPEACGSRADLISSVQGNGARSPRVGELVTVEAVVIADYTVGLGGIFVQEEQEDRDGDLLSSEGLFIQIDGARPKIDIGDVVRVHGRVAELGDDRSSLTALVELAGFKVCGKVDELPQATLIEEAPLVAEDWESYEAMRIEIEQPVTVIGNYRLLGHSELLVSLNGRQWSPTERFPPGAEARALDQDNARARLLLDDGKGANEPGERVTYLTNQPSSDAPYRVGTLLSGVSGVLDQRGGSYRLHLSGPVTVLQAARPERVPTVPGDLKLATFNLENYFNGDGRGGGFPTPRGASDAEELNRQRAKLMSALKALDADIYAVVEVENDGYGRESAIADLTTRLNQARGRRGEYDYVRGPEAGLGEDAISVGLLYRSAKLSLVGDAATLTRGPFRTHSRAPLAQTFELKRNKGRLTVVVNHFKSKGGCQDASDGNRDQGDGQACWNAARVASARALADWLVRDPTGSGDSNVLLMGDLNAHTFEDPLRLLREYAYISLTAADRDSHYTYVFGGQMGSLDHALASPSLAEQVRGVAIWHINADEMPEFGYQRRGKTRAQEARMVRSDPFRSSDHDPILVGIDLQPPPPPPEPPADAPEVP